MACPSLYSIANQVFEGCTGLTSITIPSALTSIPLQVFYGCTSLTNISVDAQNPSYSSVDGVLFDKQRSTLIIFPDGIAGSYTIPNSVTNIGGPRSKTAWA